MEEDKRADEPVRLTETLHRALTAIVHLHVSIAGSILFLVVKLDIPAPSPPTPTAQARWRLQWRSDSDRTASIPPIPPLNSIFPYLKFAVPSGNVLTLSL